MISSYFRWFHLLVYRSIWSRFDVSCLFLIHFACVRALTRICIENDFKVEGVCSRAIVLIKVIVLYARTLAHMRAQEDNRIEHGRRNLR